MCKNPINSEARCRIAAEALKIAHYVLASGDGHDLPYGCVMATGHVFWNPKGVAQSNDYSTRTLCYTPEEFYDGNLIIQFYTI